MPARLHAPATRLLTAALILSTVGLFVATGILSMRQAAQRQLLAVTVRTSGWAAYQAQLEYVKTNAALDLAEARPTPANIENLALRLELLISRFSVLYESDEARMLADIADFTPELKRYEALLVSYVDVLATPPQDAAAASARFAGWSEALRPLGRDLQAILEHSVIYNQRVFDRERQLSRSPATLPLVLMFVCGGTLVTLLGIQSARDRRRLVEVLEARQAQAAMESNFRAAIEAIPAAVLIFDPVTLLPSFVNPAAAGIMGVPATHPDWVRLTRAAKAGAKETERRDVRAVHITIPRPSGEVRSLRGMMCDIVWEGESRRLLALADITKSRDAELHMMQTAKLATLGEMATAIAHETNQPLAVIKMAVSNAKRLLENGSDAAAVAAKLDRIGSQVDRVKRITDQVRRYGRPASRRSEPFALSIAVNLAIGFVAEQYRASGIRLAIQLDLPNELLVLGEQTMFEQVIVNLLINARDALEGAQSRPPAPLVSVRGSVLGEWAVLEVEDNAGGIRADMLGRIFEPFTTTKPADKGTGLGLSMSRGIVRDMRGEIEAENVGPGARFVIRLPIAAAADERQPKPYPHQMGGRAA